MRISDWSSDVCSSDLFLFKSGPLTSAAFEVGGFIRTEPGSGRPDAQLGMGPMPIETSTPGLSLHGFPGAMCGGYVMRPESQGSILIGGLASAPTAILDPKYLAHHNNPGVSARHLPLIRALFKQPT